MPVYVSRAVVTAEQWDGTFDSAKRIMDLCGYSALEIVFDSHGIPEILNVRSASGQLKAHTRLFGFVFRQEDAPDLYSIRTLPEDEFNRLWRVNVGA